MKPNAQRLMFAGGILSLLLFIAALLLPGRPETPDSVEMMMLVSIFSMTIMLLWPTKHFFRSINELSIGMIYVGIALIPAGVFPIITGYGAKGFAMTKRTVPVEWHHNIENLIASAFLLGIGFLLRSLLKSKNPNKSTHTMPATARSSHCEPSKSTTTEN